MGLILLVGDRAGELRTIRVFGSTQRQKSAALGLLGSHAVGRVNAGHLHMASTIAVCVARSFRTTAGVLVTGKLIVLSNAHAALAAMSKADRSIRHRPQES